MRGLLDRNGLIGIQPAEDAPAARLAREKPWAGRRQRPACASFLTEAARKWAFFGGHLEVGEIPEVGIKRELLEEINYVIENPKLFKCYADQRAERYIFYSPLTVEINELELNEGWDLDLVPVENIQRGFHYSDKPKMEKPLGDIHRKILLDFITEMANK